MFDNCLAFCVFSLEYSVILLFFFVALDLVSSVLCQEIDLFCVEWDIKP